MDNKQARFILQSHPSIVGAAADPQMTDALREAARDPELAAWLESERALDETVRARLRDVQPPQGLKARVLSAPPATVPVPVARWRIPLAWAATLALLAAVAALWLWPRGSAAEFAAFRSEMVEVAAGPIRFDFASGDARELERWLNEREGAGKAKLPAGVKSLPGLGCRELKWRGRPVALLCFRAGDGRALHVFAVARGALGDAPEEGRARFVASGGMQTAAWRQGEVVYVAALRGGETELRQHLGMSSL